MTKIENVQAYFEKYDIDQHELVSRVQALSPESDIIVTGSIADGRGTKYSDIDILLMGPNAEKDLRASVHFDLGLVVQNHFRLAGGHEIEVTAMIGSALAGIVEKLKEAERILDAPESIAGRIPILDQATYRFLDDVATGALLVTRANQFESFIAGSGLKRLPDFVLLMALVQHLATREDAVAQLERQRRDVALLMTRESIDHLSQAVLASTGIANTRLQWRLQFLEQVRAEIGESASAELQHYLLFPSSDLAFAKDHIAAFGEFADAQIGGIFLRRPSLVPAMMRLSQIVQFELKGES
jgi:predicted nucleotidyltransferase